MADLAGAARPPPLAPGLAVAVGRRHHHRHGDQSKHSLEITRGSHRTLHPIRVLEPHPLTLVLELRPLTLELELHPLILVLGRRPVTQEQVPRHPTQELVPLPHILELVPRPLILAGVHTLQAECTQAGLTHTLLRVEFLVRALIQELAVTLAGPIHTQLGDRTQDTQ